MLKINELINRNKKLLGYKRNINIEKISEMSTVEKRKLLQKLEAQMKKASSELNFEEAMMLRDIILEIKADMR